MKPYYDDGTCVVYHGDCRDVLPVEADATVTDPPYGTGYYATDTDVLTWAMLDVLPRPTAVFGWPEKLVALCVAGKFVPDEWVTWWPTNAAVKTPPSRNGLARESECIAVFGAHRMGELKQPRTAQLHEWHGPNQRGTENGDLASRFMGDVWRDAAPGIGLHAAHRLHPNEKPLSVMLRLVESLSELNQIVLDPFMGSGTTLRAAKDLGRRAIGIEIEERYCEIAAKRLGQEVLAL